jgi:hypothetical protein
MFSGALLLNSLFCFIVVVVVLVIVACSILYCRLLMEEIFLRATLYRQQYSLHKPHSRNDTKKVLVLYKLKVSLRLVLLL